MHFTEREDHSLDSLRDKYTFAWDHYTGDYCNDTNITHYLLRKEQRETQQAYEERQDLTDPVLIFPTTVDSLNGIVFQKDEHTEREWGELGDPDTPDSVSYSIKRNADGNKTNWNPLMKQVGIRLTAMHRVWGLVEGVQRETDEQGNTLRTLSEGTVQVINPQSVVDWYPKTGNLEQVVVKEEQDMRSSIRDVESNAEQDTYILYELEGWTRFVVDEYKNDDGELVTEERILDSGEYEYYADKNKNIRILPIFYTEIPMPRHVGWLLAKKQNHIFNQMSRRDFALGNMTFALMILSANKDQYNDIINNLDKGYNILREDPDTSSGHRYISPDSSFLSVFNETLQDKIKAMYEASFKAYGDAAKQVTATEIRQESRSGVEAFLSLLVTSIDEFENDALWRLMQVYHKDNPSAWGSAFVKRSDDFQPKDVNEALEKISTNILNLDRAGAISLRAKVEKANPDKDADWVKEEVQRIREEQGAVEVPDNMVGA